jgi:prophage regulatory protein
MAICDETTGTNGAGGGDRTGVGTRILRSKEVCARCGLSRVTIWRMERAGRFPKRRYLTTQLVGWLEHEIDDWILSRSHRRLR